MTDISKEDLLSSISLYSEAITLVKGISFFVFSLDEYYDHETGSYNDEEYVLKCANSLLDESDKVYYECNKLIDKIKFVDMKVTRDFCNARNSLKDMSMLLKQHFKPGTFLK